MAQPLLSAKPEPPARMSYEEFLNRPDENQHVEWVNGEVILMSPVTKQHQEISGFLLTLMLEFVNMHHLGAVQYEPFNMKTGPNLPGRSPDLLFVATANLSRLKEKYLEGPADLVVEIISPDSGTRDRQTKFTEYEQGGVPEYWLIDPRRKQVTFYRRGADGKYTQAPVEEGGIYRSAALPGFWLNVNWLWQRPLPTLLTVLKAWNIV